MMLNETSLAPIPKGSSSAKRPSSAFRPSIAGVVRPERSRVIVADPVRVQQRTLELERVMAKERQSQNGSNSGRIRPQTAPFSREQSKSGLNASAYGSIPENDDLPAILSSGMPSLSSSNNISRIDNVQQSQYGSYTKMLDQSKSELDVADLPLQSIESSSLNSRHSQSLGSTGRILNASEFVKSVSTILNPPLRPAMGVSTTTFVRPPFQDINSSEIVGDEKIQRYASQGSNLSKANQVLADAATQLSQNNLEHAAMRVWWLEQNCKILKDDFQKQSKLAKGAEENAQKLESVVAKAKVLSEENSTLRRALAELHANRVSQTEQLKNSLLKATNAQKKLIVEKNAELAQEIKSLEIEISQRDALLDERAASLKIAESERSSAQMAIERQINEISDLNNRLSRWENLCSQEQSNAKSAWDAAKSRESEFDKARFTIETLREELEMSKSSLASSLAREETVRERAEDAERLVKELRLQSERERDILAMERVNLASKSAELESSLKTQAHLTDQADTLARQLKRSKDEIEVLRLRTAGSDRSFEIHRAKMSQMEDKVKELKEELKKREGEAERLNIHVAELTRTQAQKEVDLSSALSSSETLKEQNIALQKVIEKLESDLNASRAKAMVMEEEVKMSSTRIERVASEKNKLEQALRDSERARQTIETSEKEHVSKLRESMSARAHLETQLQSQGAELRGLTKQFIQLQSETLELRSLVHAKTEGLASAKIDRDRVENMLQSQIVILDKRQNELLAEVREAREELARVQGLREAEKLASENEIRLWKRQLARRRDTAAHPQALAQSQNQDTLGSAPNTRSTTPLPLGNSDSNTDA